MSITHRAAVIGSPIDHSLSPLLHQAAYDALGLTGWRYERHAVGGPGEPTVEQFVAELGPEWVGLSATMPCKEPLLRLADTVTPRAALVGAANTLLRARDPMDSADSAGSAGGWLADSTDAAGLSGALRELGVTPADLGQAPAVVVGSGATARSVLAALADHGCTTVYLAVRGHVRQPTAELAERLGLHAEPIQLDRLPEAATAAPLTVTTVPGGTDLGLAPPAAGSLAGRVVMDVGYAPWPTPLARWASAGGARVVSGLPMLVHQAAEQVRLMTGRPAPLAAMYAAVAQQPGLR